MPLDTGTVAGSLVRQVGVGVDEPQQIQRPYLDESLGIGPALRGERERQGLNLQDVADDTRVRRVYLEGLENMKIEGLPSRPFLIGYVRAYAQTLRVDPELAVARFKRDFPEMTEPLRAPVGVRKRKDGRIFFLVGGLAVVIVAIGGWNIARRAMADNAAPRPVAPDSATVENAPETAPPSAAASAAAAAPAPTGVLAVSAAEPAPQDSTLPTPYKTPGLDAGATSLAVPGVASAKVATPDSGAPSATDAATETSAATPPATFTPKGMVYGADAAQSAVTLQAKKSVTLVVHNPDGSVFFARQMAAGESFRAPTGRPLSADVSDPSSFNVYVNGAIHSGLTADKSSLVSLAN